MKESGLRGFGVWITQLDWSQVLETEGTIAKTDTFCEILQKGIDTHFPTHEIKMHISDKPRMSSKTKDLIHRRQEVFDTSRPLLWSFYRNKVQRAITSDKKEFYHNRVQRLKKSNPAGWYREIRIMTTKNKSQSSIKPPPHNCCGSIHYK